VSTESAEYVPRCPDAAHACDHAQENDGCTFLEIRIGEITLDALAIDSPDAHPVIGLGVGKQAWEHGIDRAENGSHGPNSEGEREHSDRGEARILSQHARAEAHVVPQSVHLDPTDKTLHLVHTS
jgi:hypothetical protein